MTELPPVGVPEKVAAVALFLFVAATFVGMLWAILATPLPSAVVAPAGTAISTGRAP